MSFPNTPNINYFLIKYLNTTFGLECLLKSHVSVYTNDFHIFMEDHFSQKGTENFL